MVQYTLDLIESLDTFELVDSSTNEIVHKFWFAHPLIQQRLIGDCSQCSTVLDVGAGPSPFPKATHLIDTLSGPNVYKVDIDHEPIPFPNRFFDFVYSRHTMEDIQNPLFVFQELTRVGTRGYIETPSPLVEITRGIDAGNPRFCGYIHHRYIIWSNIKTNTLYCLPKYPIIEYMEYNPTFVKKSIGLLNSYSVYWNNYYRWDDKNPPAIVVYRHGSNMNIHTDYANLITRAVTESIEYTNHTYS